MPQTFRCQICFEYDYTVLQRSHVYLNSVELNLVKCTQCGLVYLNPQPVGREIHQLYSDEYFIKWYSTNKKREFSKTFFRKFFEQYKLKPATGQKILDLGCGMGFFLEVAREWGCDVRGVEISSYAANYCREKLDIDVHCGSLETAKYPNDYFDMITAFDFLEHLSGLSDFLPEVKRVLKSGGMFISLVPNDDSLVFRLDRIICKLKKAPLSDVPEHITYFSLSTLKQLLEKYGFMVEEILTTTANDEYHYLSIKGNPKAALRAMLNNICYVLGKITNRREAIMAVARN